MAESLSKGRAAYLVTALPRFEIKFIPEPNSGCWLWTAGVDNKGYGKFRIGKHTLGAHRAAYMLYVGDILNKMYVMHKCDNPPCVNPEHLELGTHTDNMRDMIQKGRKREQKRTHCPWGHEYTEGNIYRAPGAPHKRKCKTCHNGWT